MAKQIILDFKSSITDFITVGYTRDIQDNDMLDSEHVHYETLQREINKASNELRVILDGVDLPNGDKFKLIQDIRMNLMTSHGWLSLNHKAHLNRVQSNLHKLFNHLKENGEYNDHLIAALTYHNVMVKNHEHILDLTDHIHSELLDVFYVKRKDSESVGDWMAKQELHKEKWNDAEEINKMASRFKHALNKASSNIDAITQLRCKRNIAKQVMERQLSRTIDVLFENNFHF